MIAWIQQHWQDVVVGASILATVINWIIRRVQDGGGKVPQFVLSAVAFLVNLPALNFDKAAQQLTGGRGASAPPPK